ncbi:MAG TPA: hypothetical protein VMU78_06580, partial [Methylocella sp.]|nr:hypothetical protein [Methylocella sp.]
MAKQLTLDEMLDCLVSINHPTARTCQAIVEAIGTVMAETIAAALGVSAGPATFEGAAFAGTCAPFRPAFPGQPCPTLLAHYDPDEWPNNDPSAAPGEITVPMGKYTVETTFRRPFYRHRVYEAQTPEDACRRALADHDWEGENPDYETEDTPYITGIWPGEDTAYKTPPLPITSDFNDPIQRKARH